MLISEGYHRRGLPFERIAELAATNPARAYALSPRKGTIAIGADVDLAFIDMEKEQVVSPELLHSAQDSSRPLPRG